MGLLPFSPVRHAQSCRLFQVGAGDAECTYHLNKKLHKIAHKRRAKRAISEIRKFAASQLKTTDVRVDNELNKFVWSRGVKNIPTRVRLLLARKRNESEDAKESMYTLASLVPLKRAQLKGLGTVKSSATE